MAKDKGMVYFKFDLYLQRMRALELRKPEPLRRYVPTMKELAEAIGVNRNSLSRIVRGRTKSLNFDIAGAIMTEMWERGFQTEIGDLLKFEPPSHLIQKKSRADNPWAAPPPPLTRRQHQKFPGEEFVRAYEEE